MAAGSIAILVSAGLGAVTGGATGAAISGGLALGSTLLNRWSSKASDNPSQALEVKERRIRSAVEEAQWVIGSPRVSGVLVRNSEERFPPTTPIDDPEITWGVNVPPGISFLFPQVGRPWLVSRQIIVFAENPLNNLNEAWIDGKAMPFSEDAGIVSVDITAWNGRIADLERRIANLTSVGIRDPGHVNHPLYIDLVNELENLRSQLLYSGWSYPLFGSKFVVSVARFFMDYGTGAVSAADTKCLEIKDRLEAKFLAVDSQQNKDELDNFGTFWDGSKSILQGLSWALLETRSFPRVVVDPNDRPDEYLEWGNNPPKLEIVAEGMSDNPADIAYWYLTDRCEVSSGDILNFESDPQSLIPSARDICEQRIVIEAVADGDQDSAKDITSYDVYKVLYPQAVNADGNINPGNLPSLADRQKGLAEWNSIYAGQGNARQRYQAHGIITSSMMLKPDELLQALGEAMGGWILNIGGKYKFIAGYASPPVFTIEAEDITRQYISWSIGPSLRENINAIRAEISQSRQNNYVKKSLGVVEDAALISADGYSEWNAGVLPFQIDEITSRRRMNTILRRISPGLLVGNFTIGKGENWQHWQLTAGDRIIINHPIDGVLNKTFIIESIEPIIDSQLAIVAKEDPDLIYSDSFDLLGPGLVEDRKRIPNTNLGLGVTGVGIWRGVSVDESSIKIFADIRNATEANDLFADNFDFTQMIPSPTPEDPNAMIALDSKVKKQWVLDFELSVGLKVRKVQVNVSYITVTEAGAVNISIENEYTLDDSERFTGSLIRTLRNPLKNNQVNKWVTRSEVSVSVVGISEKDELGKDYSFDVIVPSIDAVGDLLNVDAKPPTSGVMLRWDPKLKLWVPAEILRVVDALPMDTSKYLPGTIFGVKQRIPPPDDDDNGNGNGGNGGNLNGQNQN